MNSLKNFDIKDFSYIKKSLKAVIKQSFRAFLFMDSFICFFYIGLLKSLVFLHHAQNNKCQGIGKHNNKICPDCREARINI